MGILGLVEVHQGREVSGLQGRVAQGLGQLAGVGLGQARLGRAGRLRVPQRAPRTRKKADLGEGRTSARTRALVQDVVTVDSDRRLNREFPLVQDLVPINFWVSIS